MLSVITRTAVLTRQPNSRDGTFGSWVSDSGFVCTTLEKPWVDNETDNSCIPPGTYQVHWLYSPSHGCNLYHVQNVHDRTAIEIHSANVQTQLKGCIAPGASITKFLVGSIKEGVPETDVNGVTSSIETLAKLEKDMQDEDGNQADFELTIKEA